ncbi:SpoIIE family protein phosphatase [Sanguibacter suaedae]|uniref:SpoIIE family protein phosphatase n=1 Tax=Sanguibacter suaedae TaxID=2795737 RepID=A0A934I438_9MICO|nr:SpoIIE family protein phosphatase [Sanguibacter suaedae]MBI9113866.1 SpoIIE family protein phosphatase [Sanguibacter suaedae]
MTTDWLTEATSTSAHPSSTGALAREVRWEDTPLGAPETWPESLRNAVRLCFSTRFPVLVTWGPELTMIYNDGYRDMLGSRKHPGAMGSSVAEVWAEIWDDVRPLFDQVLTTGRPTWFEDIELMVNRSGFDEEARFAFSYSPLTDETGAVVGVLDIATETTAAVVSGRRLATIDALHVRMRAHDGDLAGLAQGVVEVLRDSADIAAGSLYLTAAALPGAARLGPRDVVLAASTHGDEDACGVPLDLLRTVVATGIPAQRGSALAAPLARPGDETVAGVVVLEPSDRRPDDEGRRSFLTVLASAVGDSFSSSLAQRRRLESLHDRATRSEREAQRVREATLTLQRSLLTPPPDHDRLEVAVRYRPASADLAVGGDWYDAFVTQDGTATVVIGDVAGHDQHAAAAMAQVRGTVRAIAYDTGDSPARVLERTDAAIHGLALGRSAVASAIVARIEETDGPGVMVRWSNAGHVPPAIVRADGSVELVRRNNDLILGVIPDRVRTDHTIELDEGDTLVLYTDGLVERRDRSLVDNLDTFVDVLGRTCGTSIEEFCDEVLDTLLPGFAEDDVALVLVRPRAGRPAQHASAVRAGGDRTDGAGTVRTVGASSPAR